MKKKAALVRNRTMTGLGAVLGTSALMVASASAQTNAGVEAVVTAIEGLKPDMGTVVVAGIGLGVIGFVALAAWSLVKRFGK